MWQYLECIWETFLMSDKANLRHFLITVCHCVNHLLFTVSIFDLDNSVIC